MNRYDDNDYEGMCIEERFPPCESCPYDYECYDCLKEETIVNPVLEKMMKGEL